MKKKKRTKKFEDENKWKQIEMNEKVFKSEKIILNLTKQIHKRTKRERKEMQKVNWHQRAWMKNSIGKIIEKEKWEWNIREKEWKRVKGNEMKISIHRVKFY